MAHSQVKAMHNDVKELMTPAIKPQPSFDRNGMSERLQHLKMFSRGKSPEQKYLIDRYVLDGPEQVSFALGRTIHTVIGKGLGITKARTDA